MAKESVQKLLEMMEKRLFSRFDGLEGKFDGLEGRIDGLEGRIDGLETNFKGLYDMVIEFRRESFSHYDSIYHRFDTLGQEYYAATAGIKRLEDEHKIIDHATILKEINLLKSRN